AKRASEQAGLQRRVRRVAVGGHRDALAGGEPVRLHHDRRLERVEVGARQLVLGERLGRRRRDAGPPAQLLRPGLRSLDARAGRVLPPTLPDEENPHSCARRDCSRAGPTDTSETGTPARSAIRSTYLRAAAGSPPNDVTSPRSSSQPSTSSYTGSARWNSDW